MASVGKSVISASHGVNTMVYVLTAMMDTGSMLECVLLDHHQAQDHHHQAQPQSLCPIVLKLAPMDTVKDVHSGTGITMEYANK